MDASTCTLKEIFEHDIRYLVPMFQRPYVWNDKQWQPLWDDVREVAERLATGGGDVRPHFLGAIVLDQVRQPVSKVEARLLIDGQQRLTTLQILLEAATDTCKRRGWEKYQRAFERLTRNEDPLSDDPDEVFKVWPTNVDQDVFRLVMKAESPETLPKITSDGAIARAYSFFTQAVDEWLAEADESTAARIGHLHAALRSKVCLVEIDLGEADDPQMIFETLNARGTPLLPADLIKNYLFHHLARGKTPLKKAYEQHWEHFDEDAAYWRAEVIAGRVKRTRIDLFLQHYLAMETGEEVLVSHLYAAFRSYLGRGRRSVEEELASLARYSHVFRGFDTPALGSRAAAFFSRLEDMQTTTIHPLLLHVFSLQLDPKQLEGALAAIESFLVRRLVCHLTTKNYNRLFLDTLKAIREERDDVAGALRAQLLAGGGDSVRWPTDAEFREAWFEMPTYKIQARRRTCMLLEALELESRGAKNEPISLGKNLTIEHVLPQSWEAHWPLPAGTDPVEAREERNRLLHTLGNLTLLTKALNPAVSNGPWSIKQAGLQDHSLLVLNKQLAKQSEWNESAIRTRGSDLLGVAARLWSRPDEPIPEHAATPSYAREARRLAREEGQAKGSPGPRIGRQCPIPGCSHTFKQGMMGWDLHVGVLRKHPGWHPEQPDATERRRLFRVEFPGLLPGGDIPGGAVDREYWQGRADDRALAVIDVIGGLLGEVAGTTPRVSYTRQYIGLAATRNNLVEMRPRRTGAHCHIRIRAEKGATADAVKQLQEAGIHVTVGNKGAVRVAATAKHLSQHVVALKDLLQSAMRRAGE